MVAIYCECIIMIIHIQQQQFDSFQLFSSADKNCRKGGVLLLFYFFVKKRENLIKTLKSYATYWYKEIKLPFANGLLKLSANTAHYYNDHQQ